MSARRLFGSGVITVNRWLDVASLDRVLSLFVYAGRDCGVLPAAIISSMR